MKTLKKFVSLLLVLMMAGTMLSGCGEPEVVLPDTTSRELDMYINGKTIVRSSGEGIEEDYSVDETGNILDPEGNIVIAAANADAFTCVTSIKTEESPIKIKLKGNKLESGEILTRPNAFSLKFSTKPTNAVNTKIVIESHDPGALYFPYDMNEKQLEGVEKPKDNILPIITLTPDQDGNVEVTVVASFDGKYELIVKNVLGDEVDRIPFDVSVEVAADQKKKADENGEEIPAEECEHDFETQIFAATYRTQGYTLHKCKKCEYSYRTDYVPKLECSHEWNEGKVIQPTYTAGGYTMFTCKKCGETKKGNEVPKLVCEHKNMRDTVVAPTCVKAGYTLHECMTCKIYSFKDNEKPAIGHAWDGGEVTTEPTCETTGVRTFHCNHENCKETKTETIKALGHTWNAGVLIKNPSCVEEGETYYMCTVCGKERKEPVPKIDHTMTSAVVEPTYTEQGYTRHYCSYCGYETAHTDFTPVIPHDCQAEWTTTVEATCGSAGQRVAKCTICGRNMGSETIPATGNHSYVSNTVEATCDHGGYTSHVCTVCGANYTDGETAALGHDWVAQTENRVVGQEVHTICGECGMDLTANGIGGEGVANHAMAHMAEGGGGRTYQTAVDIYDTVTTYRCSRCGATQ